MEPVVPPLVTPAWLHDQLEKKTDKLVVLDTQWLPMVGGKSLFKKEHIPGALYFDLAYGVTKTREIPRNLPTPAIFEGYVCSLGVSEDTHVVLYDHDDGDIQGILTASAPRAWWQFRLFGHEKVSVLDGGSQQWVKEGLPLVKGEDEQTMPAPGNFKVKLNTSLMTTYEDMRIIASEKRVQIIDSRLPQNFTGEEAEPCEFIKLVMADSQLPNPKEDEIKTGHMEGAKNIPFLTLTEPNTSKFVEKEKLSKLFEEVGVDLKKPLVTTCYIGHTACSMALVAAVLGKVDTSVYYGAWTEWGQKSASRSPKI